MHVKYAAVAVPARGSIDFASIKGIVSITLHAGTTCTVRLRVISGACASIQHLVITAGSIPEDSTR
jgi:hypothetical protein